MNEGIKAKMSTNYFLEQKALELLSFKWWTHTIKS